MKKTLFTLVCAALAAPTFAGEAITEPITLTLPSSTTTPTAYEQGKAPNNASELVAYYANHYTTPESALYFVGGNSAEITNIRTDGDGALTTSAANVASVTLKGRSRVEGENFVMVLPGNELIGKVVNTLTLTGSGSTSNTLTLGGDFVVAVYDNTTLVGSQTAQLAHVNNGGIVTCTLNLDNITFSESNRIMIGFRGNPSSQANAGVAYTINNIQLTATPEPATATLSLLALAGLSSRRRRH